MASVFKEAYRSSVKVFILLHSKGSPWSAVKVASKVQFCMRHMRIFRFGYTKEVSTEEIKFDRCLALLQGVPLDTWIEASDIHPCGVAHGV